MSGWYIDDSCLNELQQATLRLAHVEVSSLPIDGCCADPIAST